MRITLKQGETILSDQRFDSGTVYVGRHEQCQVKIPGGDQVAPRHLVVFEEKGQWYVDTLHDQYHTAYLNGHLLQGRQVIADACELQAGPFHLLCTVHDAAEEKGDEKNVPSLVSARSHAELNQTVNFTLTELNLPEHAIVKQRAETFSLGKGRMEYLTGISLRMLEMTDVRSLLSMVNDTVINDFQALNIWIGLRSDLKGSLHLSVGRDFSGRAIDAPLTAQKVAYACVECARAVLLPSIDNNAGRTAIACPLVSLDGSLGMVYLEGDPNRARYTVNDLDTLAFVCHQMALAIDRLLRQEVEQAARIRSLEQELARKVQSRVVPWQLPQWPELQLAVLSEQGTGICTDFYDVLPVGDRQGMILVGQTPSESTDTALCITEMSAAFRIGAVHRDQPHVLLRQVNWLMHSMAGEPRRISAGVLTIDPQTGEFFICLAGNVHAYLVGSTGKVVKVTTDGNPLVGESRKSHYEAVKGKLNPDQLLAVCTGGIFNVVSPKNDVFDEQHLLDLLSDSFGQVPARILSDLAEDIGAFTGGTKPPRDVTLLLMRKSKPAG